MRERSDEDPEALTKATDLRMSFATFAPSPGVSVRYARCAAPGDRGVALVLHGRTGFIEKYAEVMGELHALGLDVWSFDWRGQGRSTRLLDNPHKGHIDRFETYLADLEAFVERVLTPASGVLRPRLLVGHSMGAHLALRYLHDHPERFDRAALTSPMVRIKGAVPAPLQRGVAALGARLGRGDRYATGGDWGRRQQRFAGNTRTSDPRRFERVMAAVRNDPALALGGPTLGWLAAAHDSIRVLTAPGYARAITTPVLMVAGGADLVVDTGATRRLAATMAAARLVVIPGARHEILHERDPQRAPFWRHLADLLADDPAWSARALALGKVPTGEDSV